MKIKLTMEELGHSPSTYSGFDKNYVKTDIGKQLELTCTILGYEIREDAAMLLLNRLSVYLTDCHNHRKLKEVK